MNNLSILNSGVLCQIISTINLLKRMLNYERLATIKNGSTFHSQNANTSF